MFPGPHVVCYMFVASSPTNVYSLSTSGFETGATAIPIFGLPGPRVKQHLNCIRRLQLSSHFANIIWMVRIRFYLGPMTIVRVFFCMDPCVLLFGFAHHSLDPDPPAGILPIPKWQNLTGLRPISIPEL